MRRFHCLSIRLALLAAIFAIAGARGTAIASTPEASRLDTLEAQLRDMQRQYEARIKALEQQVAQLQSARGGAQTSTTPAGPPVAAASTSAAPAAGVAGA